MDDFVWRSVPPSHSVIHSSACLSLFTVYCIHYRELYLRIDLMRKYAFIIHRQCM
jgi:hypothetical protein